MQVPIKKDADVFLGMPGYGDLTAGAAHGLYNACRDQSRVIVKYQRGSLLAANFNMLLATALNMQRVGIGIKYFAMLHSDIGPRTFWLDDLIAEMESQQLDVLGVVAPIKDRLGLTSLAMDQGVKNGWNQQQRLTMREVFALPETFTSEHLGRRLLLNTGCWVCRLDPAWAGSGVHFNIKDRIVFNEALDSYSAEVESEDWNFSRQLHDRGLRIGATRKIPIAHQGVAEFGIDFPWGEWEHDEAFQSREQTEQQPAVDAPSALSLQEV